MPVASPARRRMLLATLAAFSGGARAAADPTQPLAPRMDFVPLRAGTYTLQRIQTCPDAMLVDAAARRVSLRELTTGKVTLLSFFYTYCTDPWGCPFAYATLTGLRDSLLADPALARRVRFVNISFDPTHDTPETLRLYAGRLHANPQFEWRFTTTASMGQLLPLLDSFGQDVAVTLDAQGKPTRIRNHMLKMFLVDPQGMVREIYSLNFLQQPVLLNDIRTLALEAGRF
jgi:protein SCO1